MRILLIALLLPLSSPAASPVDSALQYLKNTQSRGGDGYDAGQWRTQVTSTLPSKIGVGVNNVPFEEPTPFIASSIANILAEIAQLDPARTSIESMLSRTRSGLAPYRSNDLFYFYPSYDYRGEKVRGPRHMFLKPRWQGFANTPPDADTTSVTYLMLANERALRTGSRSGFTIPGRALDALATFRDVNRSPHIYNALHGSKNTGAYLTWLFDENDPDMPHDYFARPDEGTRIPFNKNDVDCVVNTNVLKALTVAGKQNLPGYAQTCAYLNGIVSRRQFYKCGMYYPSTFVLPSAISSAIDLGVKCLAPSRVALLSSMLRSQKKDGSWRNHWSNPRPDFVQSTSWALHTILVTGNPRNAVQREAVSRGVRFLLSQVRTNKRGEKFWRGEIFYAAIFVARRPIVWRSDAYTTASVARALVLADKKWGITR